MASGDCRGIFLCSHFVLLIGATAVPVLTGCSGTHGTNSISGTAPVTVVATSTANDRLTQFTIGISSLSLVSSSGKEVPLISSPVYTDFTHLNGEAEPLITTSLPEGTYTAAHASIGFADIECVDLSFQGGLNGIGTSFGTVKSDKVAIKLSSPIVIGSDASVVSLNLLASPSSNNWSCAQNSPGNFKFAPSFALAQQAENSNGGMKSLQGIVQTAGGDGTFTINSMDGPTLPYWSDGKVTYSASAPQWQVKTGKETVFQGTQDASGIAAGVAVEMDVTLQQGQLVATRVSVLDANSSNLSGFYGSLLSTNAADPPLIAWARGGFGSSQRTGMIPFSLTGAHFGISSSLTNLADLPFTAKFDAADFSWGQAVSVTTHQPFYLYGYLPVSTVTLMPQTVNGTVQAISTVGNFTEYTILLATYDLFPNLSLQSGQSTHLDSPGLITVYADRSTRIQTSVPIAVGGVYRLNGLIFNDHGTLRMDCARISDGVQE